MSFFMPSTPYGALSGREISVGRASPSPERCRELIQRYIQRTGRVLIGSLHLNASAPSRYTLSA
ncbi:MAG: hypothetical protein IJI36_14420, partial [Kiritimatiellae bacterium]|nr:hypothetical protein [Kiritimatiellia bacterium]